MKRLYPLILILAVPLIPSSSASAQEEGPVPTAGHYSVAFDLPEGGGAGFALRKILRPRMAGGIRLGLLWARIDREYSNAEDSDKTQWEIGIFPDLRFYRQGRGPVVPFLEVGAGLQLDSNHDYATSVRGGVGAEWFPLTNMSLSGSTGISIGTHFSEDRHDGEVSRLRTFRADTFQSTLALSLYF